MNCITGVVINQGLLGIESVKVFLTLILLRFGGMNVFNALDLKLII